MMMILNIYLKNSGPETTGGPGGHGPPTFFLTKKIKLKNRFYLKKKKEKRRVIVKAKYCIADNIYLTSMHQKMKTLHCVLI